jgi:quinolinate synthase
MAEVLAGAIWVQDRVRKVELVHLANLPGGTVLLVEVCLDNVNQGFVIQTDWEVRHDVQETHPAQGLYGTSGGVRSNATAWTAL